ncbi:MAG: hypothetical protein JXB49_08720 [Bacteroidales bacterium]|nr:hypothetical protein [Bacteroidales bacterium]
MKKKILNTIFLIIIISKLSAEDNFIETHGAAAYLLQPQSPEYIGIGNCQSAVLPSASAIFYNPTGLSTIVNASIQLSYNFIPKIFDQRCGNITAALPIGLKKYCIAAGVIYNDIAAIDQYDEYMNYLSTFNNMNIAVFSALSRAGILYDLGFSIFYSTSMIDGGQNIKNDYPPLAGGRFGMSFHLLKDLDLNLVYYGSSKIDLGQNEESVKIIERNNALTSASIQYTNNHLLNNKIRVLSIIDIEQQENHPLYLNAGFSFGYYLANYQGISFSAGYNHYNMQSNIKEFELFTDYSKRISFGTTIEYQMLKIAYTYTNEYFGSLNTISIIFSRI